MESRHFSNVDKTSHLIRPSVLYLLNQFADFDSLSPDRASDWSKRITESVLQLGAISPNSNCAMLNELCVGVDFHFFVSKVFKDMTPDIGLL